MDKHKFAVFKNRREKMSEVVKLIFTGMGTVFLILIMVVVLGNLIVRVTNMYAPTPAPQVSKNNSNTTIAPNKMAVLVSAVETLTQGKGRISKIEKIN